MSLPKKYFYKITASNYEEFAKLDSLVQSLPPDIIKGVKHAYVQSGTLNYIILQTEPTESVEIKLPRDFLYSRDLGEEVQFNVSKTGSIPGYTLVYRRSIPNQKIDLTIIQG